MEYTRCQLPYQQAFVIVDLRHDCLSFSFVATFLKSSFENLELLEIRNKLIPCHFWRLFVQSPIHAGGLHPIKIRVNLFEVSFDAGGSLLNIG